MIKEKKKIVSTCYLVTKFQISLDEEVATLVVGTKGHGSRQIQIAVDLDELLHFLIFGLNGVVGFDAGQDLPKAFLLVPLP